MSIILSRSEVKHIDAYQRIKRMYPRSLANLIFALENIHDECIYLQDFTKLVLTLKRFVKRKAEYYEHRWKHWRLSASDFESEFWEVIWRLAEDYDASSKFYLGETILLALNRRAKNITHFATQTKKGKLFHGALPLNEESIKNAIVDFEQNIIDKVLVEQLINDYALTNEDKQYITNLYNSPGASHQWLADIMGYKHKEKSRRMLKRIRKKVYRYK